MFCKFIITLAVILSAEACPAAKKANLRQEGKNVYNQLQFRKCSF